MLELMRHPSPGRDDRPLALREVRSRAHEPIRFGNYRTTEIIGTGAISTIYRAVQEPLGRIVALKALKTQIAPTSSFGEQLEREAKSSRDLVHPNIVLLLDSSRPTGRPFLVLEHVDGPSLQRALRTSRSGRRSR